MQRQFEICNLQFAICNLKTLTLVAVMVLTIFSAAHACNVPVFRFALERWRPDPYRLTVFHRGPLTNAERALIETLEEQQDKSSVNLALRTVDVNELGDDDRELFASLSNPPLPTLVVHYPAHLRIAAPVWSRSLDRDTVARLIDSPIRKALTSRLADGQTAVWLRLESGQTEQDDAAATLLQNQLKKLEQELKLPVLTDSSEDKLLSATPLQVAFSLLRVPRSEAEQPLIQMLLHSESDLAERSDPMVFPVFGRGRALLPLIGAGVTAENIHDSAAFLVGACSCEVKDQNPGFDLLLAADWDVLLAQDGTPLLASQTRNTSPPGEAELVPIPSGSAIFEEESNFTAEVPGDRWFVLGLAFAGAVVIVVLLARR
ncbi:MAG: hypothetical protein IAG10_17080 [Planctomycetaceae bacterium]|nr:hypothetical protein [Planctomycetaceae bacterium]